MKFDGNIASDILSKMPLFLDYELLVSTPGIAEADSNFMWGSGFRAPVGISVMNDEVSFNLFLPAGSEKDKNIQLFFNRVGAKFQDGLWQVRRNLGEMSAVYANVVRTAISAFPSVVLDYSYIEEGRYYAHFIFNVSDLVQISEALVSFIKLIPGYRIEYMGKLDQPSEAFNRVAELDETTTAILEVSNGSGKTNGLDADFFFIMGNYIEDGVKVVGTSLYGQTESHIPKIMQVEHTSAIDQGIFSIKSRNSLLSAFLTLSRHYYLITASVYGVAEGDSAYLLVTLPSVQMPVFLDILSELSNSLPMWKVTIREVSKLRSAIH